MVRTGLGAKRGVLMGFSDKVQHRTASRANHAAATRFAPALSKASMALTGVAVSTGGPMRASRRRRANPTDSSRADDGRAEAKPMDDQRVVGDVRVAAP